MLHIFYKIKCFVYAFINNLCYIYVIMCYAYNICCIHTLHCEIHYLYTLDLLMLYIHLIS